MKALNVPYFWYALLGYASGSILFAYLVPKYLLHTDVTQGTDDQNPGAFHAFEKTGAAMGLFVLLLELAKGFLPVWAAGRVLDRENLWFAAVLAAPVLGHAFPFWRIRRGGKAIAVSFGVLLGLWPDLRALGILVGCYLLFSLVVVIQPHLHRSIVTYGCLTLLCFFLIPERSLVLGAAAISLIVVGKHLMQYHGEKAHVRLGWAPKKKGAPAAQDPYRDQNHQ